MAKVVREFIRIKTADLVPYENNPRINDAAVDDVVESIKQCGNNDPIEVDENNVILSGHTRLKALERLGIEETDVVKYYGMSEAKKKKYRLLANKTAERAIWDDFKLNIELDGMDFEGYDFGFSIIPDDEPKEAKDDNYQPEEKRETKAKRGDLYQLGRHRLMCGDSTSAEDVEKLTGGTTVDISITSPPYGASHSAEVRVHYIPGREREKSFYKDHQDDPESWLALLTGAFENMRAYSEMQFVNIQMLADNKRDLVRFVYAYLDYLADVMVWDKMKAPPQMEDRILNNAFEFIFIFGKEGATRQLPFCNFHGNRSNLIRLSPGVNEYADIHKAVYPVELVGEILNIVNESKSVLDLFGGTGTTMIACEQTDRDCFMMELDPLYVDTIIDRWQKLTGQKAKKIG